MENNYKSAEKLLRELLEARGYTTTPADGWTPYTAISADGVTVWAAWGIDPDAPARADLLFFGSDDRADGYFCSFPADNPAEEEYYILEALAGALDEECRFNALCTKEAV